MTNILKETLKCTHCDPSNPACKDGCVMQISEIVTRGVDKNGTIIGIAVRAEVSAVGTTQAQALAKAQEMAAKLATKSKPIQGRSK